MSKFEQGHLTKLLDRLLSQTRAYFGIPKIPAKLRIRINKLSVRSKNGLWNRVLKEHNVIIHGASTWLKRNVIHEIVRIILKIRGKLEFQLQPHEPSDEVLSQQIPNIGSFLWFL